MMCIKYYQTFTFLKIEYINEVVIIIRVRGALDKEVFHNESFFKETQKNKGAINEIDAFLKTNNIKVFDYSDFKNHQEVDKGGSAMIYSANFQRQKYALKSLDDNINKEWDNKKVKEFLNEHSKNILMNDGKPLIADFGISKSKHTDDDDNSPNSYLKGMGMSAYIDPQCFDQEKDKRDERSDIYSLGVLLWELTSGAPPFSDLTNDYAKYAIAIKTFNGGREEIIPGTPQGYADIYKNCWSPEPEKRPKLDDILSNLDKLSTNTFVEFIINDQT
ncbi:kinase-like protein [Gigaspora margarita]|uniref:Kinase-like protein n=1 Tax=Gigaspora margarita TaxID=4874 RepID=A0A8H4AEP6_GIGMA|nr:kinase-like protein [Gigaspora margarita]